MPIVKKTPIMTAAEAGPARTSPASPVSPDRMPPARYFRAVALARDMPPPSSNFLVTAVFRAGRFEEVPIIDRGARPPLAERTMTPTKLLIGQIIIVFAIVIAGVWAATQWTAAMLGHQPQLGSAWFDFLGVPVYRPWQI
ncbi:MAG TPA: hypothetical protein VN029_06740, partial [Sphingomonas sp.]|nr:hypothetical protein [Sphingomonas sp.]